MFFHERGETPICPAGTTVSKSESLPEGDFSITEYRWGYIRLWFVDADKFTARQRNKAYLAYRMGAR